MHHIDLDLLRAATALVHAIPGASLQLECAGGGAVLAGHCPSADLTPCQLRRVVAAEAVPGGADLVSRITAMAIGGTLEPIGPGMYRRSDVVESVALVSTLGPLLVEQVLQGVAVEGTDIGGFRAHIHVDDIMGVSCVELSAAHPAGFVTPGLLEAVAVAAGAALMAEEVELSSRSLHGADVRDGYRRR